MVLALSSCSKDKKEVARDLLATVPATSPFVAVVDMEDIAEEGSLTNADLASKELKKFGYAFNYSEARVAVMFKNGREYCMTFLVDNPGDFKKEIEKGGAVFTREGEMEVAREVAIIDKQVWMTLDDNMIPTSQIPDYPNLKKSQSWLSSDCERLLIDRDEEIAYVAKIFDCFDGTDALTGRMGSSLIFNDLTYIAGTADFEKGKLECDLKLLDSKFRDAKVLLPFGTINSDAIRRLGGTANGIAALGYSDQLGNKILDIVKKINPAFAGSMFTELSSALANGTIGVIAGSTPSAFKGVVPITGNNVTAITELVSNFGANAVIEGNELVINPAVTVSGPLDVSQYAAKFQGAAMGVVFNMDEPGAENMVVSLMVKLNKQVADIELEVITPNSRENFIKTLIKISQSKNLPMGEPKSDVNN